MSTPQLKSARTASPLARDTERAVVTALVRVEARRLLRNPFVWGAVVVAVALLSWLTLRQPLAANLEYETLQAATGILLISAVMMSVAHLATVRDQRRGMPHTLTALPAEAGVRTRAIAVAVASVGGCLAALVLAAHLALRLTASPVAGRFDPFEALAVVAGTILLGILGVALGRWAPTLIAVPVALVLLLFMTIAQELTLWPLPLTTLFAGEVLDWAAPWRLLYLLATAAGVLALALLRHGPRRGPLAALTVTLLLAPTVAVVSDTSPSDDLSCTERESVTYCHLEGFAPWVPLWAEAAEPVARAVPSAGQAAFPVLRQYRTTMGGTNDDGHLGTEWGRGELEAEFRTGLAGRIAATVTGLRTEARAGVAGNETSWCDGTGQARTVVALWLAGHTAPIPSHEERDEQGRTHLGYIGYGETEHLYAEALLGREDSGELLDAHWGTVTDPATATGELAPLLGLPAEPPAAGAGERPCA